MTLSGTLNNKTIKKSININVNIIQFKKVEYPIKKNLTNINYMMLFRLIYKRSWQQIQAWLFTYMLVLLWEI